MQLKSILPQRTRLLRLTLRRIPCNLTIKPPLRLLQHPPIILQRRQIALHEPLDRLNHAPLDLLHPFDRAGPELLGALVVPLQRQRRVVVVEHCLGDLRGGRRPGEVGVDYVFDGGDFVGEARGRLDVAVEPFFEDVDLLAEVDNGCAEGGRVECRFFEPDGSD